MNSTRYDDLLRDHLGDDNFRQEHHALEDEFTIAREIRALPNERDLTQKQLAERIGTSQPAIARVESGNYRNISLLFLGRFAKREGAPSP